MRRKIDSIVQTGARLLVVLFTGAAALCALVIALTQVGPVRTWALGKGLEALNNELAGRIEVGEVTGNLITGFSLEGVRVIAADSTVLFASPRIDLTYQFRPILKERTINADVTIHQPVIRMIRDARDSAWNFTKLVKPGPPDTSTQASPFLYTIHVRSLEIVDARFSMYDLTQPRTPTARSAGTAEPNVDFARIDLEDLNISARAMYSPEEKWLELQHLGCYLAKADIRVTDLSGRFAADSTGATASGLRIETERTLLDLDARLDSVNFFASDFKGPEAWRRAPVSVDLNAERISTLELKRFLPVLSFLGGTPQIRMRAQGTYGDIRIETLNLGLTASNVTIGGRLRNLNRPESLFIEAKISQSRLNYSDVPIYLPGLEIPNLSYLGDVKVASTEFVGYPQAFNGAFDVTSDVGAARGGVWLDLRERRPRYSANVALAHANLAPVMKDEQYASDFTGHLIASGSGFTLPELNTTFRLVSESSTVAGRSYRKLIAAGMLKDNGLIEMDTLLAAWGPKGTPSEEAVLERAPRDVASFTRQNITRLVGARVSLTPAEQAVFASNPSISVGGTLDIRNRDLPRYSGALQGRRFALSDVIPDASTARMTFRATGTGEGFDPDLMQLQANLEMIDAELPDGKHVAPFNAEVKLLTTAAPSERLLELHSDIADVNLRGQWSFSTVVEGVVKGVNGIIDYVGRKTTYREEDLFSLDAAPFGAPVNATYDLKVKNLAPLSIFLAGRRLSAEGEMHGEISGTSQLFSLTATGALRHFSYVQYGATSNDSTSLRMYGAQLLLEIRNVAPGRIDDITTISAEIRSDSIAQFNGIVFNTPRFSTLLEQGAFHINGATGVNGSLLMAVNGEINTNDPAGYRVVLDTVRVGLNGGLQWKNVGTVRALVSDTEVQIDTLAMQRNTAEIVEVRGAISGENLRGVEINISQTRLRELAQYAQGTPMAAELRKLGGWLRSVQLRVEGTLESPKIEGAVALDSLSYARSPIGNMVATFSYADRNLTGNVKLDEMVIPIGTSEQAREQIQHIRQQLNTAVATLNQYIQDKETLPPVNEPTVSAAMLEQIGKLQQAFRELVTKHAGDTALWARSGDARIRFEGQLAQLRALVQSEMVRANVGTITPSAEIEIKALPVDLAFASRNERILNGRPVDIVAHTDSLPIAIVSPFISGIQFRGGYTTMQFKVSGTLPQPSYGGEAVITNARGLVEGNNMFYSFDSKITFRDQVLAIEEMTIRNDPNDLPGGMATVIGTINFDGFSLKDLKLIARMDQFMVLNDATQAVSDLYGPLVIASGLRPLRFSGTLTTPELTGDVEVVRGNLRMERGNTAAIAESEPANYVDLAEWRRRSDSDFAYGPVLPTEFAEDTTLSDTSSGRDTLMPGSLDENFRRIQDRIRRVNVVRTNAEQSFADVLALDLDVTIRGRLFVTMDFSPIEQLRAVLANDEQPITVRRYSDGRMDLRGSLQVLPGSKYDFIKSFDATGDITFAGDIPKTKLSITAEHNGRRLRANNAGLQAYTVEVDITGTIEKPDIKLDYSVEGEPASSGTQVERNRNAISLLLFGRTSTEMLAGNTNVSSDFSSSVISSSTSSIASRFLTDILSGGTDFIRSIDVDLSGRAASARLNVVSQFGDVIIRAGGQVTDPLNNGSVTAEIPFSAFTDLVWLRNFAFQLEAARNNNEGVSGTPTSEPAQVIRLSIPFRKVW